MGFNLPKGRKSKPTTSAVNPEWVAPEFSAELDGPARRDSRFSWQRLEITHYCLENFFVDENRRTAMQKIGGLLQWYDTAELEKAGAFLGKYGKREFVKAAFPSMNSIGRNFDQLARWARMFSDEMPIEFLPRDPKIPPRPSGVPQSGYFLDHYRDTLGEWPACTRKQLPDAIRQTVAFYRAIGEIAQPYYDQVKQKQQELRQQKKIHGTVEWNLLLAGHFSAYGNWAVSCKWALRYWDRLIARRSRRLNLVSRLYTLIPSVDNPDIHRDWLLDDWNRDEDIRDYHVQELWLNRYEPAMRRRGFRSWLA